MTLQHSEAPLHPSLASMPPSRPTSCKRIRSLRVSNQTSSNHSNIFKDINEILQYPEAIQGTLKRFVSRAGSKQTSSEAKRALQGQTVDDKKFKTVPATTDQITTNKKQHINKATEVKQT